MFLLVDMPCVALCMVVLALRECISGNFLFACVVMGSRQITTNSRRGNKLPQWRHRVSQCVNANLCKKPFLSLSHKCHSVSVYGGGGKLVLNA